MNISSKDFYTFKNDAMPENIIREVVIGAEGSFLEKISANSAFKIGALTDAGEKGLQEVYSITTWSKTGIAKVLSQESDDIEMIGANAAYINVSPRRMADAIKIDKDFKYGRVKLEKYAQQLSDGCVRAFKKDVYETIKKFPCQTAAAVITTDAAATLASFSVAIDAFISQDNVTATKVAISTKLQKRLNTLKYVPAANVSVWNQLVADYPDLEFVISKDMNRFNDLFIYDDSQVTASLELPFEVVEIGSKGLSNMFAGKFATIGTVIDVPQNFLILSHTAI